MEIIKIYLAGAMSNIGYEESIKWRSQITNTISFGNYDLNTNPKFFNPPLFYSPNNISDNEMIFTEKEAMEFDLYNLRNSNIVIVCLDDINNSVGTIFELSLAWELKIPIIGFYKNKTKVKLHPWLECCCLRMCDSMEEVVDFVTEFFLK